ncbi:hypothetical protein, partial [Moraxella canis]|uniref:hypothetical protein n=1 Tax=Moraxella canis TaxID=90239 RepID=UPI0006680987
AITSTITTNDDGVAAAATPAALATAGDIAKAINQSGFKLAAEGTEGSELIRAGETATFNAGDNLTVSREGGTITYKTKKYVTFNNVQLGDNGPKISSNEAGNITVANNQGNPVKIAGLAEGTDANDAVNVSQLTKAQNAATTKVAGDQGVSIEDTQNGDGSTTYTIAAKTDDVTITVNEAGNIAAITSTITTNDDGVAAAATPAALATAGDIAKAINQSGFKLAAEGTEGSELIRAGETATFNAGDNLTVSREGGTITYKTKKYVTFNNVQLGDNGPKISSNEAGNITVANNQGNPVKIAGLAEGTDANDAVNVSQLTKAQNAATTKV